MNKKLQLFLLARSVNDVINQFYTTKRANKIAIS